MQTIATDHAPAAIGPYSQGTLSSGLIHTSMQIPIDPATGTMPPGIEAQTKQVLRNIDAIARAGGSSLDRALKVTVYLADLADFPAMNEIYGAMFGDDPPARAAVEVSRIPRDALIAMDAVIETDQQ
jgi:2-iminobutanoate/2-iminopropanoate deaminase